MRLQDGAPFVEKLVKARLLRIYAESTSAPFAEDVADRLRYYEKNFASKIADSP